VLRRPREPAKHSGGRSHAACSANLDALEVPRVVSSVLGQLIGLVG
jgi:hypothetical protein